VRGRHSFPVPFFPNPAHSLSGTALAAGGILSPVPFFPNPALSLSGTALAAGGPCLPVDSPSLPSGILSSSTCDWMDEAGDGLKQESLPVPSRR